MDNKEQEQKEQKYVTLHTGSKMPVVGFGTLRTDNTKELVKQAVLEAGYRHLDTAAFYNNEEQIGEALAEIFASDKGIKREDLFITTKLNAPDKANPREGLLTSLKKLKLDYVDLYLVHFPVNPVVENANGTKEFARIPLYKVWGALEECVKEGLTKHIGISNFNIQLTLDLLTYCNIKPAVNQIEVHPYNVQHDLVEYNKKLGIAVTAYCSLGSPGRDPMFGKLHKVLIEDPKVLELAEKYKKTPGQILLNWSIQRGQIVIPKASSVKRMKENLESQNFALSSEDVEALSALDRNDRIVVFKNYAHILNVPIFA